MANPRTLFACLLLVAAPLAAQEAVAPARTLDRSHGLPGDEVFDLCASGEEVLWAATSGGLCRIERHGIVAAPESRSYPDAPPYAVAAAEPGAVYAFYPAALLHVTAESARRVEFPDAVLPASSRHLAWREGELWTLTDSSIHHRSVEGAWRVLPLPPSRTPPRCLGLLQGKLAAAGEEGTWVLEEEGWRRTATAAVLRLPRGAHDRASFDSANEEFLAAAELAGMVWYASARLGLLFRRERARFRQMPLPLSTRVNSLAAGKEGSIWCGTERGLAHVHADGTETIQAIDGRALGAITALAVDREGQVWIGSGSSFAGVYRLSHGVWSHLGAAHGFVDAFVHRITLDPSGALWFAVLNAPGANSTEGEGAWVYSAGLFRPSPAHRELPSSRIYDVVARDSEGALWFATLRGLAAFDGTRLLQYAEGALLGEKVWCLCAARDGSLWVGYQGGNLGVSRLTRGTVRHYSTADGLGDPNVWSIIEAEGGVLWFATERGLSRFDGKRWSSFGAADGLPSAPLWPLLPGPAGSLWIGTLGGGLVRFEPDDREGPHTRFVDGLRTAVEGEEIAISWVGMDAWYDTPASDLWYRWRVGADAWSEARPTEGAQLRLPAGSHRFQVQAIDRFGNAEDPPGSLDLEVGRPFPVAWVTGLIVAAVVAMLVLRGLRHRLETNSFVS
ncbi:MAG: ligand-binding sensor domain-containing protein [Planctomycetaceae bacterium]